MLDVAAHGRWEPVHRHCDATRRHASGHWLLNDLHHAFTVEQHRAATGRRCTSHIENADHRSVELRATARDQLLDIVWIEEAIAGTRQVAGLLFDQRSARRRASAMPRRSDWMTSWASLCASCR